MREVLDEVDLPMQVGGLPATPSYEFTGPDDPEERQKLMALVSQETAKRGVLLMAHPRHSSAHGDRDLSITLEAFREALLVPMLGLQRGQRSVGDTPIGGVSFALQWGAAGDRARGRRSRSR